jgi:hemerythrin-like domain-containing protein
MDASAMSEHDEVDPPAVSSTLAETARRRADLHRALVELEQTISSPAVGREADWSKEVVRKLQDLRHTLAEHVEVTERPDGLYDEISQRAPRLAGKIEHLRNEHPEMRDATADLTRRLETTSIGNAWPLADARDDLQRLLGRIVRHRQLGADLVWEAYNLDIGGIE